MDTMTEHTIETRTHGRYLVAPAGAPDAPLLVGFHGYSETAEEELERYSQELESYDRATELEDIGGKIIDLPMNAWETISVGKAA